MLNTNLLGALKGIVKTIDFYIEEWKIKRYSWADVEIMYKKKSFRTMLTQLQPILNNIYYVINEEITNHLMVELQEELEFIELMTYSLYCLLALGCLLIYYQVVLRVRKLIRDFKTVIFIFPFELLEKNLVMKHHLKKVSKGAHVYKF